ncbi:MAG: O-antigen ligase family protein [Propionibacteriaceae bacterium]|nr:O-antigen ligase family protein [Propionibacteriaceae bacterium]
MSDVTTTTRFHPDNVQVDRITDFLVGVLVVFIALRIPGSLFVVAACSMLLLVLLPLQAPDRTVLPWLVTMMAATASSGMAVLSVSSSPEIINFATITMVFLMVSATMLLSPHGMRLARVVVSTLYWCFGLTMMIGIGEIVTGFRLSHLIYPELVWAPIPPGPFEVSAFYPNYNDFSVIVTMFATMVVLRVLFDHSSPLRTLLRVAVFTAASGLIFLQGSRGALAALMLGMMLAVWLNLRTSVHTHWITLATVLAGLLGAAGVFAIWESPWVQDNSTKVRGLVLERVMALAPEESAQFWVGWGTRETYRQVGENRFPGELTDPHNVFFEAFIWYGFPVTVLLVICWALVTWRGVLQMPRRLTWQELSATVMVALLPVLGVVPSSTFRYYFIFLFGAAAFATLSSWRQP